MNSKDPINSRVLANFVSVHLSWQGAHPTTEPLPHNPLFMSITSYQNIICLIIDVMLTGYPLNNGIFGGNNRVRTYDPLLVRQVLSQLSYASASAFIIYQILFVL